METSDSESGPSMGVKRLRLTPGSSNSGSIMSESASDDGSAATLMPTNPITPAVACPFAAAPTSPPAETMQTRAGVAPIGQRIAQVASENRGNVVIMTNSIGNILSVNYTVRSMFGYEPSSLIGKNVSMLMPPPYSEMHEFFMKRYIRTGEARVIGTSRCVEGLHSDGSVLSMRLTLSDVSVGEEIMFLGLLEKVQDEFATITISEDGTMTSVNRTAMDLFGYTTHEMVGKKVNMLQAERYAAAHDGYLEHYLRTGERRAIGRLRLVEGKRKDGSLFPMQLAVEEDKFITGERYFRGMIFSMESSDMDPIISGDVATETVRTANNSAALLFGFSNTHAMEGLKITQLLPTFSWEGVKGHSSLGRMILPGRHQDDTQFQVFVIVEEYTLGGDHLFSLKCRHTSQKKTQARSIGEGAPQQQQSSQQKSPYHVDLDKIGQYIGHYRVGKVIGTGSWGIVISATHRLTGKLVAIKAMRNPSKAKPSDHSSASSPQQGTNYPPDVNREIKILKTLYHPNIACLYEIIETPDTVFLVMEHCSGGELFDYVCQYENGLEEHEARKYFRDVLGAVDYMHHKKVIHRDIKLENLLLDAEGHAKLIDFGMSNFHTNIVRMSTFCGSPAYTCPEIFMGKLYSGPEVDIWSLGVVLFALVSGFLPFDEDPRRILRGHYALSPRLSPDCADLIRCMLEPNASKRVKIDQIIAHPWVNFLSQPIVRFDVNVSPLPPPSQFDKEIIMQMSQLGFPPKAVNKALEAKGFNQITATYRFLYSAKQKRIHMLGHSHPSLTDSSFSFTSSAPSDASAAASASAPTSFVTHDSAWHHYHTSSVLPTSHSLSTGESNSLTDELVLYSQIESLYSRAVASLPSAPQPGPLPSSRVEAHTRIVDMVTHLADTLQYLKAHQ